MSHSTCPPAPRATISANVASHVPSGSCSNGSSDSRRVQSNIENLMF